jgi:hypothetical protein
MHEIQVRDFLKVCEEYAAFPAIRAMISAYIIHLSEENGDRPSAFVA